MHYYYTVKARLAIFNKLTGELEFPEFERRFENENPIIAREAAFDHYENFIHGLLLGQGLSEKQINQISHKEVTKILQPYINPGTYSNGLPDYIGNGIRVSLVIANENEDAIETPINVSILQKNEIIIHWINEDNPGMPFPVSLISLEKEYAFYVNNNFDTKGYIITIEYLDYDEYIDGYHDTALEAHTILETPFDWTGYDKLNWWGTYKDEWQEVDNENVNAEIQHSRELSTKEIIQRGESQQVEFKPSLLYHFGKKGYSRSVRYIIAKVICSFLNSKGGKLFIGLADDGKIQGLSDDLSLAQPIGKDPRDYFQLEADKMIREYFKDSASYICGEFEIIDNVEIFVFTVFPNTRYPVFITGMNGKEFFVRLTTSTEPYNDVEQIVKYCLTHWTKNST